MSATISRPFMFTEFQSFDVPSSDETTWKPVRLPNSKKPDFVTSKFIYVFQALGAKTELYLELRVEEGGELSVYSGRDARTQERDKRGDFVQTGSAFFTLPHTINDKRAYYYFVVSRIRLPGDAIASFETQKPPSLGPALDLDLDETFLQVAGDDGTSTTIDTYLPVIDPITIALNLHAAFEQAANNLIGYTMAFKEQTPAQGQAVHDRHKALLLAKLLKSVVDGDPGDKLGLVNEFQGDDPKLPEKYIKNYDDTVDRLVKTRDKAAEPLLFFLNGKLLSAIEDSYRFFEVDDYDRWLEFFFRMMERVTESPLGKARLGKLIDEPNYAFKEYVLRTSTAPNDQFSVGRKANSAIVGLWREAIPGMLTKTPDAANKLANALTSIAHVELVKVETKEIKYTYRKGNGRMRTVVKTVQETTAVDPAVALEHWAKNGIPGRAMERLVQGIELINLYLAFDGLLSAEPDAKGFAALNLLGSVLDAVSAFGPFLKIAERTIKIVGAISAVIDTILATRDGLNAYQRDDGSSAVGFGLVATGSVLAMAGCVCVAAGLGAGVTVIGLPLAGFLEIVGAVLVAAGWVLAVFTADTDIEQFTTHCKFGKNNSSTSSSQPSWASAPFKDWAGTAGLDHQVRSLLVLLAAFTVEATDYAAFTVTLGLIMPVSQLHVKITTLFNPDAHHNVDLMLDLVAQTAAQLGGDPQDMQKIRFGESSGRPVVTIQSDWPDAARPTNPLQHRHCDAEIQLLLDGSTTVPVGKPMQYLVSELDSILSGPKSSHD